jgi:hypothetical protein
LTYPIPDEALDDRLGWIGTSGSGKTYNAGGGVERLLQTDARVIVVDPLDVWWGLRLTAEGKPSRFTLPIFGGEHGDLPLNEQAGKLIGGTVAGMAESCIVSLGGLATKEAERRFMLHFLEAVYRHASGNPVHIIFDEADMWAPQNTGKGAGPQLQALMEQIVRRGRVRGFIPWLITQRPAVLSKDVLSQMDGLVAFKLTASQDRDALGAWIEGQADRATGKEILGSLPTMQRGQGVVWVPGRAVLATVQFPAKSTFDSSRTPTRGERRERHDLKPLDLGKLKERLSSLEDEAKANDPKALKSEVSRLKRELAAAEKKIAAPPPAERVVVNAEEIDAARKEGERVGIAIGIARAQHALSGLRVDDNFVVHPPSARQRSQARAPAVPPAPMNGTPVVASDGITKAQQRILNSLAWWQTFGIEQPTNEQVAFIAGYSPGSGNFNNLKGGLRTLALIDYPAPGRVSLTESGSEKAEASPIAVTQDAFHSAVRAKLNGPQVRLLDPVIAVYPENISSQEIADQAGYSAGSGNFNNLRGSLRTIGLIDYPSPGYVRAADWLFPA